MFELAVALKYLLPRRRQLSVSIISLISILVISLVVWLILVFFSVTNGLEKIWVTKMISLTAPLRVLPQEAYYQSYYYQIDALASASGYATKSFSEKLRAEKSDPYNPEIDEALPESFPKSEGKDLVKEAVSAIHSLPEVSATPFEMTVANLKLNLVRGSTQSTLSQTAYIGTFDPQNPLWDKTLLAYEEADLKNSSPEERLKQNLLPPKHPYLGEAVLLPKSFKAAGVLTGDRGWISYWAPTTSTVQEMRQPVFVAGFYDPGIIPVGGKFLLASEELTGLIRSSHNQEDTAMSQGINVRFDDLKRADRIKGDLSRLFSEKGIEPYFRIETYKEFDFTKDLIQQLQSEKNIFTLISTVIIIVACSNIISMLIILVNDKKLEIGILRSMGASQGSIAFIFGLAGTVMGLIGSSIGIMAALLTLNNLNALIQLISRLQGFQAFNPLFFGSQLPHELSFEALAFVSLATILISILSGIIPAVKASRMRPSEILRSE